MNEDRPKRKNARLRNYDYSSPGIYFLTICTENRKKLFWETVGATIGRPQDVVLSECGKIVDDAIQSIPKIYSFVTVNSYVIMPNHIHLLIQIHADEYGRPMAAPTVSRIINHMKGFVSKKVGKSIWQKLYYDHIVRNEDDYNNTVKYICENPVCWKNDELYSE
ncbi:MAG: transposase [Clostridia bacterium]|nr:transposase [Clostridia bacterium]MBR7083199.1 transposase [Clostridia bacterium]